MALFRMRRSVKCLLKMLLAAVCYAVLVVGILTVYNMNTGSKRLTPFRRTEGTQPVCNNSILSSISEAITSNTSFCFEVTSAIQHCTSAGYLNYDVWRQMPGYLVDDMRVRRSFPNHPDIRKTTDTLRISFSEVAGDSHVDGKYAHKVYGFLQPLLTGYHAFAFNISGVTASYGLELWLSNSPSPLHTRKILTVEHSYSPPKVEQPEWWQFWMSTPTVRPPHLIAELYTSEDIWLDAGSPYYIEFLEKAFDGSVVVELEWKPPGSCNHIQIKSYSFLQAVQLSNVNANSYVISSMATMLQGPLPSNVLQNHKRVSFIGEMNFSTTDLDVLPYCNFTAHYATRRTLTQRQVHEHVFVSGIYPPDETINWDLRHFKIRRGEYVIQEKVVKQIVNVYNTALNSSTKHRGSVEEVHYVEETRNLHHGSRFLLEFGVRLNGQSDLVHTSEYVYLPAKSNQLCHTANFNWEHNVFIYLIVSLKNLGIWTTHLIHNIEHIQRVTKDFNVELVIVDFESSDLNVEAELSKSSLPKWHYIKKSGPFSRAGGLQAALDYVTDPNSIVLTLDMHLAIPPGFVNYARKHVVKGKMALAPMFFRLDKGYTEVHIQGFWEPYTFGIFGMYKSDWDVIGGFNTERYTHKWGEEDVDVAARCMNHGYEIFRIRYPGFLHYYHSRKGLWDSKQ